ncbi:winged helix-turn-helix DNA-binding protein [Halanaerobium sp. DL-01]|uniref:winged helix-turn-helix transcriptional regulator n=1 Tax=Halanaerobium sp. DL-01 TaxID=1653064 RepID=UPI000DF26267|nr:winged helix-turn-helix transcriptional regulator [Halanaerobium sp. DL-01]RCW86934.1 winged helix-turn-helix DNA-binding protein [Halanaerobium sp. DL-01]
MEKNITDILNVLDDRDNPSQREIAKETGISLGLVNTLIKKCAKKGLVKIERLNARNIKYILTPAGIKEKTEKTLNYIKKSYRAVKEIEARVLKLVEENKKEEKNIYLYEANREESEILDLIETIFKGNNIDYEVIYDPKELGSLNSEEDILYHWDLETDFSGLNEVNIFRY